MAELPHIQRAYWWNAWISCHIDTLRLQHYFFTRRDKERTYRERKQYTHAPLGFLVKESSRLKIFHSLRYLSVQICMLFRFKYIAHTHGCMYILPLCHKYHRLSVKGHITISCYLFFSYNLVWFRGVSLKFYGIWQSPSGARSTKIFK